MKTLFILASCVVVLATTAPTALAHGRTGGYGAITDTLAPDGWRPCPTQGHAFATDTLAPGGGQARLVTATRSFRWPDAEIGAGVGIGSILGLAGGTLSRL